MTLTEKDENNGSDKENPYAITTSKIRNYPSNEYGPGYIIFHPKKRRPIKFIDSKKSFGIDDGKGAQSLLFSYVDEVLDRQAKHGPGTIDDDQTNDFLESPFLKQIEHPQFSDIPYVSQIRRQAALIPVHTTEKATRIRNLCTRLKRNDGQLVRARINSEGIDDKLAKLIAQAMTDNIYLQHLMLHDNAISDDGVLALSLAGRWSPSLHTLWLGANLISDVGAKHLGDLVRRNPNVKVLNLSNKWPPKVTWTCQEQIMHPHITYIGAEYFAKQLMKCCGLTSLSFADQRIRDGGASALFRSLKVSNLRTLNLKSNEITDACCYDLRDALSTNPRLEKLDLSHNLIGDEGIDSVSIGLTNNNNLKALNISYNQIDVLGMESLLKALEVNHSLSTLFTIYNKVFDERAETVVGMRQKAKQALHTHPDRPSLENSKPLSANASSSLQVIANDSFWSDDPDTYLSGFVSLGSPPLHSNVNNNSRGTSPSHRLESPFGNTRNGSPNRVPSVPDIGIHGHRPDSRSLRPSSGQEPSPEHYAAYYANVSTEKRNLLSSSSKDRQHSPNKPKSKHHAIHETGEEREDSLINDFAKLFSSSVATTSKENPGFVNHSRHANLQALESPSALIPRTASASSNGRRTPKIKPRLSTDIGKTLGVPFIGQNGVMPVRSATSRHRDSAQHLLYLRVSTPDDPPEARPYSLIQIAKDQRAEIARVRAERQQAEYKEEKHLKFLNFTKKRIAKAAEKAPPLTFWKEWNYVTKVKYPRGIDKARGVGSTKSFIEIDEEEKYSLQMFEKIQSDLASMASSGTVSHPSLPPPPKKKVSIKSASTPGGALAARRMAYTLKKEREKIQRDREREKEVEYLESNTSKIGLRAMMGLRDNQTFSDVLATKGSLTTKNPKVSNVPEKRRG